MKNPLSKRLLSLVLAVVMCVGLASPAFAAEPATGLTYEKVDNSLISAAVPGRNPVKQMESEHRYADSDMLRVSIVLDKPGTIAAGYSTLNIVRNEAAMSYRAALKQEQAVVTAAIERQVLNNRALDVVWNMTLAANIISANVQYGQIKAIEAVDGVAEVLIETRYEPMVVETDGDADPNMATSSEQIGSAAAWAAGYTGAGSIIAVIDTGTDTDHQSFDAGAFEYSLSQQEGTFDLLDIEELKTLVGELNVSVTAEQAYHNSKLPFGYNYVDKSYEITHDKDTQGGHGSHVAGIATANAYVPDGQGGYTPALSSVCVQGVAPDAQLITLKVFGKNGGAYESDYIVAIEDAIILGADAVNLSLGSANPGRSRNPVDAYQQIMDNLVKSDTVVSVSAGNSGHWADYAINMQAGYLYATDVSTHTGGAPGTFPNSFTVGSVDNDGGVGYFIQVGDRVTLYDENTFYGQNALRSLAGEQEFVFFTNVGVDASGTNLLLDYADVIKDKIVFVSRGSSDFSKKHDAADAAGAIACIVYNNAAGIFGMDLSGSRSYIPCVSITREDAFAIRDLATAVTDDAGNVLYYTGTMNVGSQYGAGQYNSEYYTLSSFSSWGVPGSLELKPEILAPGGDIYSVDGTDYYGKAYTLMSGTSMAAPQITGMAALVSQYIRENGLAAQQELTVRALAQSLLMSTAKPLIDGTSLNYYPVLQQGAGLADVGAAISADSYVIMGEDAVKTWADGKVKAELGDDPDRAGVYTFSFTLNNLTDVDKVYTLSAEWFAQGVATGYINENLETGTFMDRLTVSMDASTVFTVNGKELTASGVNVDNMDFNGDGTVNAADGQHLLDFVSGVVTELANATAAPLADQDDDGDVDSYDAYLFFTKLDNAVTLPAGGSAEIRVTVTLSEAQKAQFDADFENGTYVEGFVFVSGASTSEGVEGTDHSIPVLGFYGNWSDASMYDPGSYPEYRAGVAEHLSYMNIPEVNAYIIEYANEPGVEYYFGGNPMVADKTYMPERNAFNNENGDLLNAVRFSLIRNAADSRYTAVNKTTGEVLDDAVVGAVDSAYFYPGNGSWLNNNWILEDLFFTGAGATEGDEMELSLIMAPEYYMDETGAIDWEALGKGAAFSVSMVIDNTAPVIDDVKLDLENNTLTIIASDNEYVSAVALYNKSGTKLHAITGAKQEIGKGEKAEYVLDLSAVNGKRFAVQVTDYAMNTSTYLFEQQIGEELALPSMIGYIDTNGEDYWTGFDINSAPGWDYYPMPYYAPAANVYTAATMVDHIILTVTDKNELYAVPADDMGDLTLVGYLGCSVTDMAYDKANGIVYGVTDKSQLIRIDPMSAEVTELGKIGINTNTLAYKDGVFYSAKLKSNELYSFTLETMAQPTLLASLTYFDEMWWQDVNFVWDYVQAMEIDPNTGKLIWTSYSFESILYDFGWGDPFYSDAIYAYLIEVDPATGEYTVHNDFMWRVSALAIPEKTIVEGEWAKPVETADGVHLSQSEISVFERYSTRLTATVSPWTSTDRSVTWTSADPSIATVNQGGIVTGVSEGTTTVTATSNLDPSLSASCTVTVEKLQVTLDGVLQKAAGDTVLYTWDQAYDETWTEGVSLLPSLTTAAYDPVSGDLYLLDNNSFSWRMHRIDPATGEIKASTESASTDFVLWDITYSQYFSSESNPRFVGVYEDNVIIQMNALSLNGLNISLFDYLYKYGGEVAVAIASAGYQQYTDPDTGDVYDTELFYVLDDAGNIWYLWVYNNGSGYKAFISCLPSTLPDLDFEGYSVLKGCSMHLGEDGALYLSYFTGITNEIYRLAFDTNEETWVSAKLGDFGRNVWPAVITGAASNAPAGNGALNLPALAHVDAVSSEETANDVTGGLNSVVTSGAPVQPLSGGEVGEGEDTVTVTVTATDAKGVDVDSTNGLVTVTYDTDMLTLTGVRVNGDYRSVNQTEGSVTFAYVALKGIPAGQAVATLTFSVNSTDDAAVVGVTNEQVNNGQGGSETLNVSYDHANTEVRDAVDPTCTEDGYSGNVHCADCGKLLITGEPIPALGHDPILVDYLRPTPVRYGYSGDLVCSRCGTLLEKGHVLDLEDVGLPIPGVPSAPASILPFTDVNTGDWFYEDVLYMYLNRLMNGTGSGTTFSPNLEMTRGMIATILYRMEGQPPVFINNAFPDVDVNEWYGRAVEWAAASGIVTGYDNGNFAPNDVVTREQLATILFRYAAHKGFDVSARSELTAFADAGSVSSYATEAMQWAVAEGLIQGGDGKLMPTSGASRAQVAAIIHRFLTK